MQKRGCVHIILNKMVKEGFTKPLGKTGNRGLTQLYRGRTFQAEGMDRLPILS